MALHVIKQSGPPAEAPSFIGQHYIDTDAKEHYLANGTDSANDWQKVDEVKEDTGGGGSVASLFGDGKVVGANQAFLNVFATGGWSTSGDQAWASTDTDNEIYGVGVVPGISRILASGKEIGGAYRIADDLSYLTLGATGAVATPSTGILRVYEGEVFLCPGGDTIWHSPDGGNTWNEVSMPEGTWVGAVAYDGTTYVALDDMAYEVLYSTDLASWTSVDIGVVSGVLTGLDYDGTAFYATEGDSLYKSTDGVNWSTVGASVGLAAFSVTLHATGNRIYVTNGDWYQGAKVTEDEGTTWNNMTLADEYREAGYGMRRTLFEDSQGRVYIPTGEGSLLRSEDGGKTFEPWLTAVTSRSHSTADATLFNDEIFLVFGTPGAHVGVIKLDTEGNVIDSLNCVGVVMGDVNQFEGGVGASMTVVVNTGGYVAQVVFFARGPMLGFNKYPSSGNNWPVVDQSDVSVKHFRAGVGPSPGLAGFFVSGEFAG